MATKNPTDSEIAEWLKAESGDEKLAFVFEETVCFYVPDRGHVQGMFMRDELSEVLVAYLVVSRQDRRQYAEHRPITPRFFEAAEHRIFEPEMPCPLQPGERGPPGLLIDLTD